MVGDGEHGEQEHESGLQWAHERPISVVEQKEQQKEREVQGRGRGLRGDNVGRARRHRFSSKHKRRRLRDGAAG